MIETSKEFKEAVYAPIRKTTAKINFEILDNDAYEDAEVSSNSEAPLSRKEQVTNKVRRLTNKYATFERNYFRLDGSFRIPPKPEEDSTNEVGWWSGDTCGADGIFVVPQTLTLTFTEERNSMGLTIYFDMNTDEYATDFDIDVYQADDILIASEKITGNKQSSFIWVQGLDGYRKIVITVRKWVNPYRRARIAELDFGVVNEYEGDKLIKVNLIEQMNVVGDTLPANELKFTIDNSSKEFNILNPEGFYRFLKERQEVSLSFGVEIEENVYEYVQAKGYFLTDWQSDEGALTTTFTARNIFELLEKEYNPASTFNNFYDLAEDVLISAGVIFYSIDESLRDIPTEGFPEKLTYRKALQCIGIASKSAVYQDRSGTVIIKPFEILDESTSYIHFAGADMFTGMVTPTVYSGFDMKKITFDNVYKEPQIKLDKLLQSLIVTVYEGATKLEYEFHNPEVKEGASLKVDIPLINSLEHARDVAQWIITESNLRALYQVNWRQNPSLEPGDIVFIEDSFGAEKQSRITKQEYEFAGYLNGKTESKGGV
ncbi:hypothetical protein [Psychrobacillus lasiicapitis]|uniref:Uncharacterized protein n=1 Tax=Psychrobacillus lasiicapitis TaxID=1636719 RepID=A0A544TAB4_9BACI|nr:hypothetical protein [Psychrobacillus lasiicapitis]TQR14400.1 hypothetical protein FG382_08050 [Psychrobacillus lasiicapitis]GGA31676.1 hypothetical protein GCM10011384_21510 [Psychrobacillus lasiicapitis]